MKGRYYIGLMSGTSLDGIDAAMIDEENEGRVIAALTRRFPEPLATRLETATISEAPPVAELMALDREVASAFADATHAVLQRAGLESGDITAIGSHGHTLRHLATGDGVITWQIGDPNHLAAATGIPVVADFRRRDTAEGGQGAPLVPAFHAARFADDRNHRAVLNLGGMANITILPPARDATVTGFDTGPGNILLNEWARRHLDQPMDLDGAWSECGRVRTELLARALDDPFFKQAPPKSTGRETFNAAWLDRLGPEAWDPCDVQATLVALTARTVADAVRTHAPSTSELLICGGGIHNRALVGALVEELDGIRVASTAERGLDPDWVEAAAFAWLARERLARRPGNEPGVTGARRRVILGGIYAP
ncbi:MAG: anhydro-N-acetylmuramic acid kinase [Pseudomonadota bacterium]